METGNGLRVQHVILLAVALAVLYYYLLYHSSLFTSGILQPNACSMAPDFKCSASISPNGTIVLLLQQVHRATVYAVGFGCNADSGRLNESALMARMQPPRQLVFSIGPLTPSVTGTCRSGGSPLSGGYGSTFTGYLLLDYTSAAQQNSTAGNGQSGPFHLQYGTVTQKVGCADTLSCMANASFAWRMLTGT